ncbi:hypothetical protein ASZ90_011231 [hydrocarbon metagenome]|uniref:Uncharacterized protein n=1 Tax=hydrocarbon metagenome TaxID=938273 RepID=A0A0W8FDV8_9ZZZZ
MMPHEFPGEFKHAGCRQQYLRTPFMHKPIMMPFDGYRRE